MQLSGYRQLVQDLGFDGYDDNLVDRAVNLARQRVMRDLRPTYADDIDQSLTTTAGVATVTISGLTDYLRPNAIRLLEGTDPLPMDWRPTQLLRDMQTEYPAEGTPKYWTERNGVIIFYPTPDRALTLDIELVLVPDDLLAGVDDPFIPHRHADLVQWAAAVNLHARNEHWASAGSADNHYKQTLLPAAFGENKTTQRQTSRRVRTTGQWGY